jgi:hypothetical protein
MFRFPAGDEEFLFSRSSLPLPHVVTKFVCRGMSAFLNRFCYPSTTLFRGMKYHMQIFSDDLIFFPNYVFYFIFSLCNYARSDADYPPPPHCTTAPGRPGPPYHPGFTITLS